MSNELIGAIAFKILLHSEVLLLFLSFSDSMIFSSSMVGGIYLGSIVSAFNVLIDTEIRINSEKTRIYCLISYNFCCT